MAGEMLLFQKNGRSQTSVLFADGHWETRNQSARSFLDEMCRRNGSSLEGRKAGACYFLGSIAKPPILISERTQQIFFPLFGEETNSTWICFNEIFEVRGANKPCADIYFLCGRQVTVEASYRSVKRQMGRCRRLLHLLDQAHASYDYQSTSSMLNYIRRLGQWEDKGSDRGKS